MIKHLTSMPSELLFTAFMVAITLCLSVIFGLPIVVPTSGTAAFVGIHYLFPVLGVFVWATIALLGQRRNLSGTLFLALPCYAVVLLAHFNIKLWLPLVNPARFDAFYWAIDQKLGWLVTACMDIRHALAFVLPLDQNFYMISFIVLFYVSFCYHALRTPEVFRTLFLAALFFQGLGALAYLPFPALGPFLYQPGIEASPTAAQQGMLGVHRDLMRGGADWLAREGGANITAGLAAMPSLHSGGAFLFFLFAWRHAKVLVPLYSLILAYIIIAAVANRWHYVIDIPAGIALALGSIRLADFLTRSEARQKKDAEHEALRGSQPDLQAT